ncbi:hypothetical protein [Reinekea sp.]|jgi:thiamine transport system permease protein|uniref:hypothetical protein n=1 Tax=Reinekea sp. TaxID=1970455 RepID=UPI003989414F
MQPVNNSLPVILNRVAISLLMATLALACLGLFLHPGQGYPLFGYFDAWLVRIIKFSFYQAFLSAFLSIIFAIPFALILSYRSFRHSWILKALLNLFFIMPVLTIVLSVVSFFSGWLNVFSLAGIIIAHMLLNIPYALRVFWQRLDRVSIEHRILAQSIGMSWSQQFKVLQWPILKSAMKPIFVIVFLFCFSSFTIVLTLGGGPANTNLEVAIYQALKFDFDPQAAAVYAIIHGIFATMMMLSLGRREIFSIEFSKSNSHQYARPMYIQLVAIVVVLLLLASPIVSLLLRSFSASFIFPNRFFEAITNSLLIAFLSAVVSMLLAIFRCSSRDTKLSRLLDFGVLLVPSMVILTGIFLVALRLGIAYKVTWGLIIWMNALMTLPFITAPIHTRYRTIQQRYHDLSYTLDLNSVAKARYLYWPLMKSVLPWAFALSMVLSVGDLGVAALIGSAQFTTLPILIYQAMGSYQMILATQLSVILLMVSVVILMVGEWLGEEKDVNR